MIPMYPDEWFGDSGDCQPAAPTADPGWRYDSATRSWNLGPAAVPVEKAYPPPAQPSVRPHVRVEDMSDEDKTRIWNLIREVSR